MKRSPGEEKQSAMAAVSRSVFDLSSSEDLSGLREVSSDQEYLNPGPASDYVEDKGPEDDQHHLVREVSDKMVCLACKCSFANREEQIEHYKLDWHRLNLKLKMTGLSPLTAEEFEKKSGEGDLSSISASESESEGDSDSDSVMMSGNVTGADHETSVRSHRVFSKVVFQNAAGEYLSVHRNILHGKSAEECDVGNCLKAISKKTVWVILMTGGGHFAGAVFEGKEVLQHKTLHRYTVRAKRGTAQGLRDSQNQSHTPKSAGAALRRHNEAALVKDIQDLLAAWAERLKEASAIFVQAPSYNKAIFFGGHAAPLNKKDPRVRTIPFATRRATFREVQRVQVLLATVHVYSKDADLSAIFSPAKKGWKKPVKPAAETNPEKEIAGKQVEHSYEAEEGGIREPEICSPRHKKKNKKEAKMPNEEFEAEAAHQEERQPEATPSEDTPQEMDSKNRSKRKARSEKKHDEAVDEPCDYGLRDALFTACKTGDVDTLRGLLNPPGETTDGCEPTENNPSDVSTPIGLLNQPIDSSGFTLLHVATAAAQKAAVRLLLDAGADPASRDNKGRPPYIVAPDKDTRNVFRKYMGEHPEKYDYSQAKIPTPVTAEMESKKKEKKKAQKAQKKQRDKEQKEEKRKQELEEEEEAAPGPPDVYQTAATSRTHSTFLDIFHSADEGI